MKKIAEMRLNAVIPHSSSQNVVAGSPLLHSPQKNWVADPLFH
jgi:hypothetical protein